MKIKYVIKENDKIGTHSFYAVPKTNGTMTFDELCEEACEDNCAPEDMKKMVRRFMKTVRRNALKGIRCEVGEKFLTVYPNLQLSVKDYIDPSTGELIVAKPEMLNARNAKSRLGCTVNQSFSKEFSDKVEWQRVDENGYVVEEDDATQGNENVENGDDNTQTIDTSTNVNPSTGDGNDGLGG